MKFLTLARASMLLLSLATFCIQEATASTHESASDAASDLVAQCSGQDLCKLASMCCQGGVDETGWIAAAVGWSLWFLTLILFCVGKLMNMGPDEPKYMQA
ncbi:transmembrane protein 213 [Ambystoma mexicanum]|uniref:transmembrane protein 213 n=1 Tax=Ambystoma mexicanum TaxID=8296 RepID=UPI0037E93A79